MHISNYAGSGFDPRRLPTRFRKKYFVTQRALDVILHHSRNWPAFRKERHAYLLPGREAAKGAVAGNFPVVRRFNIVELQLD